MFIWIKTNEQQSEPSFKTLFKLLKVKTTEAVQSDSKSIPFSMQRGELLILTLEVKCLETMKQIQQSGPNYCVSITNENK